jgi:hypothetical protein
LAEGLVSDYPTFAFLAAEVDRMRIRCLLIQVRQGKIEEIIAPAKALAVKTSLPPVDVYNLACVYALAAATPRSDVSASEELVQNALTLLTRLESTAHFGTRERIEHARKDEDLRALKEREEFRNLLDRAEKRLTTTTSPQPGRSPP